MPELMWISGAQLSVNTWVSSGIKEYRIKALAVKLIVTFEHLSEKQGRTFTVDRVFIRWRIINRQ